MNNNFEKIISGYNEFKKKYCFSENPLMKQLGEKGQSPEFMFVACSDSRVDPAILLQCDPGDIFSVRNIANIVPHYNDNNYHGTSAALEYGICYLNIPNLVIMGHSKCGGVQVKSKNFELNQNDFIENWTNQIELCDSTKKEEVDSHAKHSLLNSYKNCLTFPWIKERLEKNQLKIHLWFLDIDTGNVLSYNFDKKDFVSFSS